MFYFEAKRQILPASDWELMDSEWVVFKKFDSEVESRIVESLLRARGFEVQLLDTHVTRTRLSESGLRLMVRSGDLARAEEALRENQQPTHLEVVGEEQPMRRSPLENKFALVFLALATIAYILSKF